MPGKEQFSGGGSLSSGRFRRSWRLLAGLLFLVSLAGASLQAESATTLERKSKAVFLLNFARFTEWPDEAFKDAESPLGLCFLNPEPYRELWEWLRKQTVKNRRLTIHSYEEVIQGEKCHLFFINTSDEKELDRVLESLSSLKLLTVGEAKAFSKAGGVINFVTMERKLRFEINLEAAKRNNLKLSSKLIRLGISVKD